MTSRKTDLAALLATADALRGQLAALLEREADAPTTADDWIPISQINIARRTLRRAIRAGELPGRQVGREYHVRQADVDRWIATRPPRQSSRRTTASTEVDACIRRSLDAGHLKPIE